MDPAPFKVQIKNEDIKFSSAHMTVFADGTKEGLHGHNFVPTVVLFLKKAKLHDMVPFGELKKAMKGVCDLWNEKALLPESCPFFKLNSKTNQQLDFSLCGKHYVLPLDEIVLLPVDTVTTENLAEQFCHLFLKAINASALSETVQGIEVSIEERPGQGASYFSKLGKS